MKDIALLEKKINIFLGSVKEMMVVGNLNIINWEYLNNNIDLLSDEFIEDFQDKLNWTKISVNQGF